MLFSAQLPKLPCLVNNSGHAIPLLTISQWLPTPIRVKAKVITLACKQPFRIYLTTALLLTPVSLSDLIPLSLLSHLYWRLLILEHPEHPVLGISSVSSFYLQPSPSPYSRYPHSLLPHFLNLCSNISITVMPSLTALFKITPSIHCPGLFFARAFITI